jgi:hypothetical protein
MSVLKNENNGMPISENLWKGLLDAWKIPFIALCKVGFNIDQYS